MRSEGERVKDKGPGLQERSRVKPQQWEITPRAGIAQALPLESWQRGAIDSILAVLPQGPQPQPSPGSLPGDKGDCHNRPTW